jgi:hypothetical protein
MKIAAHEHYQTNDGGAEHQPNARHDIHGALQRARERPAILDGARPILGRATQTLRPGH